MSSTSVLSRDRPIRLEAKSTVEAGALDSQIHASSRNVRLDLNRLSTEIDAAYQMPPGFERSQLHFLLVIS
jgi:hypothetical protein